MKVKKRQPAVLMRIAQIHHGVMQETFDRSYFVYEGTAIQRVRLFGTIIKRFDRPSDQTPSVMCILDDGSETIAIRAWGAAPNDETKSINRLEVMQGVDPGDIVDVIGRVREYNGEKYVIPEQVMTKRDIAWEMYRRAELVQLDIEQHGLGEERNPFDSDTTDTSSVADLVLAAFTDGEHDNTVEMLAQRTKLSVTETKQALYQLMQDGRIFNPRPTEYVRISD